MRNGNVLMFSGPEVADLLRGRELDLIEIVRRAYLTYAQDDSSLPHSTFLRFPGDNKNRIIALPAYLGGDFRTAGIKWVSSFPDNLQKGFERASAVVILNSILTGRPEAIFEGSLISAKRTAASAVLAAQYVQGDRHDRSAALLGCGSINLEIARFLLAADPKIERFIIFDVDVTRAQTFKENCLRLLPVNHVEIVEQINQALGSSNLISIATTAVQPHILSLGTILPGTTILHISLRDLAPEVILACDNVVDDIDHVCRAQTSIHLAEAVAGNRDFIRCTLADILLKNAVPKKDEQSITIFSPFGLGILDLAVGTFVRDLGLRLGKGTLLESFFPAS